MLENFDPTAFARDSWQRKASVVRKALPHWRAPLTAQAIWQHAASDIAESRLVSAKKNRWQLQHGPFAHTTTDKKNWTLLLQAADTLDSEVASLYQHFNFLPRWAIDDIMVSLSATGGNVGPHFDRYDAFLLQTSGRKEWRLGQHCDANTALTDDDELLLLKHFETRETIVLEAGDLLYIPPGLAHWGIALDDDSITYSVGCRAPTVDDALLSLAHFVAEQRDTESPIPLRIDTDCPSGAISDNTVMAFENLLRDILLDTKTLKRALGSWLTEDTQRAWGDDDLSLTAFDTAALDALVAENAPIQRSPTTRFAYIDGDDRQPLLLCIGGECYPIPADNNALKRAARHLCQHDMFGANALAPWLESERGRQIVQHCFTEGDLQMAQETSSPPHR